MKTCVRLVPMPVETSFAPLGALGYCLMRSHFLDPLWEGLALPMKEVDYRPEDKLLDMLVSILAGCRAIAQINTRLRPDLALAQAWGRRRFADQATVARTLNVFDGTQMDHLRSGSEALFRRESLSLHHDFAADWLYFDIDLTALPISKHAEGSTKGKLGEKTAMVGNWLGSMRRNITRRCSRTSTQAVRKAAPATCRRSRRWTASCPLVLSSASGRSCVRMPVLAAMTTSTRS